MVKNVQVFVEAELVEALRLWDHENSVAEITATQSSWDPFYFGGSKITFVYVPAPSPLAYHKLSGPAQFIRQSVPLTKLATQAPRRCKI